MNIALIDDGIHVDLETEKYIQKFLELKDISEGFTIQKTKVNFDSHGTNCAKIIRKISKLAKIYSLKILDSYNLCGSASKLIEALKWCLKNNIELVNLSLGTTNSKDFIEIKRWINCLSVNGIIIVAAINNKNTYTMPASLTNVIGVSSIEYLKKYKFIDNSIIGIDILACSQHKIFNDKNITTPFCNSYAAPYVSGKICDLLYKDYNRMDYEDKIFIKNIKKILYAKYKNLETSNLGDIIQITLNKKQLPKNFLNTKQSFINKIPIINVKCSIENLQILNRLFYNDNFFPIVILYDDINNKKLKRQEAYKSLDYVCKIIRCDILILYNVDRGILQEDLYIEADSSGFKIFYSRYFIKIKKEYESIKMIYKKILELLE